MMVCADDVAEVLTWQLVWLLAWANDVAACGTNMSGVGVALSRLFLLDVVKEDG